MTHIVCTTDLSDGSAPTVHYAIALAEEYRAALTVLHVIEGIPSTDNPAFKELPETGALQRQVERIARQPGVALAAALSQASTALVHAGA